MRRLRYVTSSLALLCGVSLSACRSAPAAPKGTAPANAAPVTEAEAGPSAEDPAAWLEHATALAKRVIVLDGHIDLPMRLRGQAQAEDPRLHTDGNFDLPRARAGGLDAPFMSIYIPAGYENGGAKELADELIDLVASLWAPAADGTPSGFAPARSPAEVRANFAAGRVSLPMGMENGAPVEGQLANLQHFFDRGIRYITLTHSEDNHICDSSYDDHHTHGGLSPFGREVVAEMNRLGIMVDVSHISDDAFWQVMELSKAPVIASHSSCRHFTPGFERNMSDEMIVALAEHEGVIQINFGSGFLDAEVREARNQRREAISASLEAEGHAPGSPEYDAARQRLAEAYDAEHPAQLATVKTVADHIDHVVQLVGIEHVGLGSDFDGVGDSLPVGLEDVSKYPALFAELLSRGYSDEDLTKLAGENVLRVWNEVERVASASTSAPN